MLLRIFLITPNINSKATLIVEIILYTLTLTYIPNLRTQVKTKACLRNNACQ